MCLEQYLAHGKHNANVSIYYHYYGKKLFNQTCLGSYPCWAVLGNLPNLPKLPCPLL